MKTAHAILLGLALIAAAIVFVARSDRATAEAGTRFVGDYAFAAGEGGVIIGRTTTGEAWRCGPLDFTCKRLGLEK